VTQKGSQGFSHFQDNPLWYRGMTELFYQNLGYDGSLQQKAEQLLSFCKLCQGLGHPGTETTVRK